MDKQSRQPIVGARSKSLHFEAEIDGEKKQEYGVTVTYKEGVRPGKCVATCIVTLKSPFYQV